MADRGMSACLLQAGDLFTLVPDGRCYEVLDVIPIDMSVEVHVRKWIFFSDRIRLGIHDVVQLQEG
jgi:hypothetical protein